MKHFKYLFLILVLTTTLGQFFSDLYLPSLPAISKAMSTTIGTTQLTITLYMLGYSVSALIYGPLSDTIGRKKPLIIGLSLCLIGSAICAFPQNIYILIFGRLLQGLGGGVGISVTQAIVRDTSKGSNLAKLNSYLAMANVVVIVSAPILGGYFQEYFNWHASFMFLLIYSIFVAFLVIFFVPETKSPDRRIKFKFTTYRNNLLVLLRSKNFVGCQLCLFALYGGIMAWMTAGPILLLEYLHLTPGQYGWTCCLCGVTYTCGAFLNAKLVLKVGIKNMLALGKFFLLLSSGIMLILAMLSYFNFFVIVLPIMLFMVGGAMFFPNTYAAALTPFGRIAGFASSLLVSSQIFGGFISSLAIAVLPCNTQFFLALILIICSIIIIISSRTLIGKI